MTSVRIERDGPVAHLVLLGPGAGNAMGPATWDELPAAFAEIDADDALRTVVLRGSGDHFSYGLDLRTTAPIFALERPALLRQIEKMQAAFTAVERARVPVIAALAGWCIGAGLELAAACDLRYAQTGARFALREVQLGIVADLGGLQRLPAIVGAGIAREMALTGATIDAERAQAIGFVNAVVPDVFAHATAIAAAIAAQPPQATAGVKAVMNATRDLSASDGLAYVAAWNAAFLQSDEVRLSLEQFLKRG